jgi:lipoprotein-anchoring transpeptidase ErfK/SrfK
VTALTAVGALLLAGCTASANAQWRGTADPSGAPVTVTTPGALSIVPAANAKNISPGKPVVVSATGSATVTSVTLTAGSTKIKGALSADGHTWTSSGKLAFGTTYKLTVATTGLAAPTTTSTFSTVKPAHTSNPTLQANAMMALDDGGKYGVGEPLIVHFSHSVPTSARAAAVAALTVTAMPSVEGRWHWIDGQDVHYRPETYWAAQTTITLNAALYGVNLGGGYYGSRNVSATIHIGDSHVAIADNTTHHMKVYVNGVMTKDIPVSLGMGGTTTGANGETINFYTRSGPHVVIQKLPEHDMSSTTFGIKDPTSKYYYAPVKIYDTVRISYTGEFVHKRTWALSQIGHLNTSHGCINVGPKDIMWVYNLLIPGDIVDVLHTPIKLPVTDGLGDWTVPWSQW